MYYTIHTTILHICNATVGSDPMGAFSAPAGTPISIFISLDPLLSNTVPLNLNYLLGPLY